MRCRARIPLVFKERGLNIDMDRGTVIVLVVILAIAVVAWQIIQPKAAPASPQSENTITGTPTSSGKPVICTEQYTYYNENMRTVWSYKKPSSLRVESSGTSALGEEKTVIFLYNSDETYLYIDSDGWISLGSTDSNIFRDLDKSLNELETYLRNSQIENSGSAEGYSVSCRNVDSIPDSEFQVPPGESVLTYAQRMQNLAQDEAESIASQINDFVQGSQNSTVMMLKSALEAFSSEIPYRLQITPLEVSVDLLEYDRSNFEAFTREGPMPTVEKGITGNAQLSLEGFQLKSGSSVTCSGDEFYNGAVIYIRKETSYEYDTLLDGLYKVVTLTIDSSDSCGDLLVLGSRSREEM